MRWERPVVVALHGFERARPAQVFVRGRLLAAGQLDKPRPQFGGPRCGDRHYP